MTDNLTTLLWAIGGGCGFIGVVLVILFNRQEKTNGRVSVLETSTVKYEHMRAAIKDAIEGVGKLFEEKDKSLRADINRVDANVTKFGDKMDVDNKAMMTLLGTIKGAANQHGGTNSQT